MWDVIVAVLDHSRLTFPSLRTNQESKKERNFKFCVHIKKETDRKK